MREKLANKKHFQNRKYTRDWQRRGVKIRPVAASNTTTTTQTQKKMSKRSGGELVASVPTRRLKMTDDMSLGSFYSQGDMSKFVAAQNPADGAKVWNEGLDTQYVSMAQYYMEHPQEFPMHLFQKIRKMETWMLNKFPMMFTDGNEAVWTEFKFDAEPMAVAARGTLPSQLTVRKETNSIRMTYYSQGFLTNMYTYDKEPELFRQHLNMVVSNFFQSIMLNVCAGFRTGVFDYCKPEWRMPDISAPKTIEEADEIIRNTYCELNKDDMGISKIAMRLAQMFGAKEETLDGIVMDSTLSSRTPSATSSLSRAPLPCAIAPA
jgi:hypothetical protein